MNCNWNFINFEFVDNHLLAFIWCIFEVCMSCSSKVINVYIQAVEISCRVLYRHNIMYYHGYLFVREGARLPRRLNQVL